jgi:hypothetical protein
MLTNVSGAGALVKELNKVSICWNLCNLLFISVKNTLFNTKVTLFGILN